MLAIVGDPIEHSLTPRIQNAAWQAAGAAVVNVAFRVAAGQLDAAVRGAQALGLLGLMVTIPHKEQAARLADELDESARLLQAANLLHFTPAGRIVGYSSDGWAALRSLQEAGETVSGRPVVILGGGGAARSLAFAMAWGGAASVIVLNRTAARGRRIVEELNTALGREAAIGQELTPATLRQFLQPGVLLINATSVGMTPAVEATPVPAELLPAGLTVYDIVYNPLQTRLLRDARRQGANTVDGLGMLVYTNVRAAEICAGVQLDAGLMRREALEGLK